MSSHAEWISQQLAPFGPRRELPELIQELNRLYHASEARDYERKHVEIFQQLPQVWSAMVGHALQALPDGPIRILDFGCGTGFEARQLLACIPGVRIAGLLGFDLSPEMVAEAKRTVLPLFAAAEFTSRWEDAVATSASGQFNLLATNSLLHHLPDISVTLQQVESLLTNDAVWVAGHEPSIRYYQNPECVRVLEQFRRQRRWRRFTTPSNYVNRVRTLLGLRSAPAADAARRAVEFGLFERRPPESLVARLVDYHVPHSESEAAAGRGLNFEEMERQFDGRWRMLSVRTYAFMGPFYEGRLTRRWANVSQDLAQRFPRDGSNFATVWQRQAAE